MLDRLGLPRDACLMIHSAFKDCARSGLNADEVINALVDETAAGTLLLPAMSWRFVKPGGTFSELETPSNVGALAELFRTRHATHRSLHPTHSVAGRGRLSAQILADHHHCSTPCGEGSPFDRLVASDAWIMMLGITMDCCTLIHRAEERIAPQLYLRPEAEDYVCRDRHGRSWPVRFRRHAFLPRDFWQVQDALADAGCLRATRLGIAMVRAFRARDLCEHSERLLRGRPEAMIARGGQRYRLM